MKKFVLITILFTCFGCNSQTKNNYSFFKLLVTNGNKEIMLVEWDRAWEIPGQKYTGESTVHEFINGMANKHGIEIDNLKLNAMVTFHYNNRPNPTLMHYYTANYRKGTLKTPSGCSGIKWMPAAEAFNLIPYKEMVQIMKKINMDKDRLWGAAYDIRRKSDTATRTSTLREEFHILN